jgi:DNA-binding NarL/FixJ family response regulator
MTIGVLVVDDQQAVRSALRLVLDAEPDIGVVGEAGNGGAAILAAQETAPDVVLMDIRMPRMDGLAAIREPATTRSAPAEREREVLLLIARGLTNA